MENKRKLRGLDLLKFSPQEISSIYEAVLGIQDQIKNSPSNIVVRPRAGVTDILMQIGTIREPSPTGQEANDAFNIFSAMASQRVGISTDIIAVVVDKEKLSSLRTQLEESLASLHRAEKARSDKKKRERAEEDKKQAAGRLQHMTRGFQKLPANYQATVVDTVRDINDALEAHFAGGARNQRLFLACMDASKNLTIGYKEAKQGNSLKFLKDIGVIEMFEIKERNNHHDIEVKINLGGLDIFMAAVKKYSASKRNNIVDDGGAVSAGVSKEVALRVQGDKLFWFGKVLDLSPTPRKILDFLCRKQQAHVKREDAMKYALMGELSTKAFKTHLAKIRASIKKATKSLIGKKKRDAEKLNLPGLIECRKGKVVLNLSTQQIDILQ